MTTLIFKKNPVFQAKLRWKRQDLRPEASKWPTMKIFSSTRSTLSSLGFELELWNREFKIIYPQEEMHGLSLNSLHEIFKKFFFQKNEFISECGVWYDFGCS